MFIQLKLNVLCITNEFNLAHWLIKQLVSILSLLGKNVNA